MISRTRGGARSARLSLRSRAHLKRWWFSPGRDIRLVRVRAVAQIGVDLSSESLRDDRDDLTAAQAAALRALLDAAVRAVVGGSRLQVSVYRQDNSPT